MILPAHGFEIRISSAERIGSGLLVTFEDGIQALFQPRFLYESREMNGNRVIVAKNMEDPERGVNSALPQGLQS